MEITNMTKENQPKETGISISIEEYLDNAVSKILSGEKDVELYLSEKTARKIAAAVLEEREEIKNVPVTDFNINAEMLCRAKIKIIYED